jgi:hypothetical protein
VVKKLWCAVRRNVNGQATAKHKRLGMIDSESGTADKLDVERLEWHAPRERPQTALERFDLDGFSIAETSDRV